MHFSLFHYDVICFRKLGPRGVDLLRTLSDTEIEALTLEVSPIVVEVGETIIAAGDSLGGADDAFYIIHRGEFDVRDR